MYIKELIERYPVLAKCEKEIREAKDAIIKSYETEGKLLICGNGGSCADSDHICGELLKSFVKIAVDLMSIKHGFMPVSELLIPMVVLIINKLAFLSLAKDCKSWLIGLLNTVVTTFV